MSFLKKLALIVLICFKTITSDCQYKGTVILFTPGEMTIEGMDKRYKNQLAIKDFNTELYFINDTLISHFDNGPLFIPGIIFSKVNEERFYPKNINYSKDKIINPSVTVDESFRKYYCNITPHVIKTINSFVTHILLEADTIELHSTKDTISQYTIFSDNISLRLDKTKISKFQINGAQIISNRFNIITGDITNTRIDSLILSNVELKCKLKIINCLLPDYIEIKNITNNTSGDILDLSQFNSYQNKTCKLNIGKDDVAKVNLNYKYFTLDIDNLGPKYLKEWIYSELLRKQKENYFQDGYEKLDKEYKEFHYLSDNNTLSYFKNWVDKHWWDYGYDKFKIITNSFTIFIAFLLINFFLYHKLKTVYYPEKFKQFDERLNAHNMDTPIKVTTEIFNYIKRIPIIILYTAFIFWGLKLDLKELELRKPLFLGIVIVEYVIGIICLAYIANYIITK